MQPTEKTVMLLSASLAESQAREGLLRDTLQVNHDYLDECGTYLVETGIKQINDTALEMPFDDTALRLVMAQRGDVFERIRSFNIVAGNTHDTFNVRQSALYAGLQCEELAEKMVTLGFMGMSSVLKQMASGFKEGSFDDRFVNVDRADLLDDDIDMLVVTIGSMLSQGANVHGAFQEVHRANMDKVWPDGTMHRDSNGKVVKPEGWKGPDLSPFIFEEPAVAAVPPCDPFLDDLGTADLGITQEVNGITN